MPLDVRAQAKCERPFLEAPRYEALDPRHFGHVSSQGAATLQFLSIPSPISRPFCFALLGCDHSGYRDSGFWPGDVAAGVVGGAVGVAGAAVGTAGAIATAPFRSSYNSYDGYNGVPRDSYAQRMGFVCQPGTWFRGEDGRRHICQ
jgi:hypothetical protein